MRVVAGRRNRPAAERDAKEENTPNKRTEGEV